MGDVGKAMERVLWTDNALEESLLGHHRQASSHEMQHTIPDIYSDGESDDESEMEWEGWMRDLERQSRVEQQSGKSEKARRSAASRQMHTLIGTSSSLPSPPLSEASPSCSPRVRSPSLSAAGSFGSQPHTQYPNISNVIHASGIHGSPRTPERMKNTTVSTVSVGMAPSSRRRSSTLFAELGTRDKGKPDRVPFPSTSANGARATVRTVAGLQYPPSASLRHARSSSNLRVSSSPYGSDVAECAGNPGPSPRPKRQSAFLRGMSLRAGKLVRGLESAIDFVDEKNV